MENNTNHQDYIIASKKHFMEMRDKDRFRTMLKNQKIDEASNEIFTEWIEHFDLWGRDIKNTLKSLVW